MAEAGNGDGALFVLMDAIRGEQASDCADSILQGDHPEWQKPPVDLVSTVLSAGGQLLQLPLTQAGWRDFLISKLTGVLIIMNGHPVVADS